MKEFCGVCFLQSVQVEIILDFAVAIDAVCISSSRMALDCKTFHFMKLFQMSFKISTNEQTLSRWFEYIYRHFYQYGFWAEYSENKFIRFIYNLICRKDFSFRISTWSKSTLDQDKLLWISLITWEDFLFLYVSSNVRFCGPLKKGICSLRERLSQDDSELRYGCLMKIKWD